MTVFTETLAKDLGLKNIVFAGTKSERILGIYKSYLLAVSEYDKKRSAFFGCKFDTDEDSVFTFEFSQALTETLNDIAPCTCTVETDGITVNSSCEITEFRAIIDETVEMLSANEIPSSDKCSVCGTSFAHLKKMVMQKDGKVSLVCKNCALDESLSNNTKKSAEKPTSKQRLMGVLGAVLGSIVSFCLMMGICYLASVLINTEVSLAYGVCALCFMSVVITHYAAKLFCRKKDVVITALVCVLPILFNIFGRIIVTAYEILPARYSLTDALRAPMAFLKLPFVTDTANITTLFLLDAIFALVAISIFVFGLFATEKNTGFSVVPYVD